MLLIDEERIHASEKASSYIVPFEKGFYPVRLEYFQKDANPDLQLICMPPGGKGPWPVPFKYQHH